MIYRARALVTMDGPPLDNGAVWVEGGRIRAAGAFQEVAREAGGAEVIDLGEQVLLPGLINAHCHLDYTMMRGSIDYQSSFSRWISRINAIKRSLHEEDYLRAIASGFEELRNSGVTTVLNIESFPELMLRMPPPPIRAWWFYEMIDIRNCNATEELVAGALSFLEEMPEGWLGGYGLSPHAPYTASAQLYQLANACAAATGLLLTTHVAESIEEEEMFGQARGNLYDFMASIGRDMGDCGNGSSTAHLLKAGLIGAGWIVVHLNEIDERDFALLSAPAFAESVHLVHCPRSHRYFRHHQFPYKRLHDLGFRISLGTDSLASNDSLNLFSEMQELAKNEPWLPPGELLKTVTLHPARALRKERTLGRVAPGAHADMICLPFDGEISTVHDEIVHFQGNIHWMLVEGEATSYRGRRMSPRVPLATR